VNKTKKIIQAMRKNSKRHKIGRNEMCPCKSGKKYKKCCLLKKPIFDLNNLSVIK